MLVTLTNVTTSPILRSIPNNVTIILKMSLTVDGVFFCCCACTGIKAGELIVTHSISRDVKVKKIIALLVPIRKVVAVVTSVVVSVKSPNNMNYKYLRLTIENYSHLV
jgi:hypothetical protein